MFIDFFTVVERNMLVDFRKVRLIQLFRVLIAQPLQFLFGDFALWRSTTAYKSTISPQVCSLEMAAKRLLDADITITELDGKPYDFLVTTYGNVDVTKLTALLKTYKLAGKSFIYALGNTVYSCKFTSHVDEDIVELYSCKFIEHVDEDDGNTIIELSISKGVDGSNASVTAEASRQVKSDITITGKITSTDGGVTTVLSDFILTINTNERLATTSVGTLNFNVASIGNVTMSPTTDVYYKYVLMFNGNILIP